MIHVLIERTIADGMLSTYEDLTRKAMQRTYVAPGFISGEAFTDTANANRRFLLCKWRSAQDWYSWARSEDRLELTSKITPILSLPERVTVMENYIAPI